MAGSERVLLADATNRELGWVRRDLMRMRGLWHRASFIFVFDTAGALLVSRRTLTKDLYPGQLDLACGGVVLAGETLDESARREAEEELGIRDTPLEPCSTVRIVDGRLRCHGGLYRCVHEGPFTLQTEEVDSVEFVQPDALDVNEITADTLAAYRHLQALS